MGYSTLEQKIAERGIKKSVITATAGITTQALNNKLCRKSPFTWPEVLTIQRCFFRI